MFCTPRGQDHTARVSATESTSTYDLDLFIFRNKSSKFTKSSIFTHREMKTNGNVISSPVEWLEISCRAREKLEFTLQNIETELYILNQLDEFISELTNRHVIRNESHQNCVGAKIYTFSKDHPRISFIFGPVPILNRITGRTVCTRTVFSSIPNQF